MKIKYHFNNIYSNADTIKVSCGTEDIITLNKSDFDDDWNNAINKDYYINEAQCGDLVNLKITGVEDHTAVYEEDVNTKWKEFTKNIVGSKHLSDPLVINKLDNTQPVKIYNQTDFTSASDITKLTASIWSNLGKNYTYDLSNIDTSAFSGASTSLKYLLPVYYSSGIYDSASGKTATEGCFNYYITKWHTLPEDLYKLDYGFYYCAKLKELPDIPESITSACFAFYGCTSLTEINDIMLPNATSTEKMFQYCSGLTKVGNIELPKASTIYYMFSNCSFSEIGNLNLPECIQVDCLFKDNTKLEKIGDIYAPKVTANSSWFSGCSALTAIGNIYMPLAQVDFYDNKLVSKVGDVDTSNYVRTYPGNSTIGNITYHSANASADILDCPAGLLGIVNMLYKVNLNLSSNPLKCTALPYYYGNADVTLPSSTGFDLWVDYTSTSNDYVHNITNPTYNITENKETLNTSETVIVKKVNVLEKNASYDHTFELVSCSATVKTAASGTNVDTANMAFVLNSDGTADLTIPCTNIKDDSVSSGKFNYDITYIANIDGHEFHGKTNVTVNFSYTWQLNEDVSMGAELVNDDGSDYTEETTNDTTSTEA